mmetsp:Transcript_19403/g.40931  ORF Transcript_19403/g.40931 Transcript_19403/m.40931 type:complete len:113 (+) Transcript_19403:169-507(+)
MGMGSAACSGEDKKLRFLLQQWPGAGDAPNRSRRMGSFALAAVAAVVGAVADGRGRCLHFLVAAGMKEEVRGLLSGGTGGEGCRSGSGMLRGANAAAAYGVAGEQASRVAGP